MKRFVTGALVLAALAACGDATGPKTDISGRWSYNASNVAGSGVSCTFNAVVITLSQSGNTFTGVGSSGTFACSGGGSSFTQPMTNVAIANGQINGNAIQFDIGTQDVHNTGSLSGNSMSGTVAIRVNTGTNNVVLSGNFSAIRQ